MRQRYPGLHLYIRENTTANLIAELLGNKLDIALLALPYDVGRVETRIVYREGFHLTCHKHSALIDANKPDFDILPDESLLLLDDGHCLGVTLIPDMALGLLGNKNIKTRRLPEDRFYRDIGFAWRKGHSRKELLNDLMALLGVHG